VDHFEEQIKAFSLYLEKECGLAKNTLSAYISDLKHLSHYLHSQNLEHIQALTSDHLLHFLSEHQKENKSNATLARYLFSIRSFFRFLKVKYHIDFDVTACLDAPKIWRKLPTLLNVQQVELLLNSPPTDTFLGARDKALLEMLYATGARVSEVCRLRVEAVQFRYRFLKIIDQKKKERLVPLSTRALHFLENYLGERREGPLFLSQQGGFLRRETVWRIVKKYADTLGFLDVSPHTLRHSFASHLLENGADLKSVQEMLGYTDVTSTQRYKQFEISDLKNTHQKYHPRGN
jgi:integrase/recombinase XerD